MSEPTTTDRAEQKTPTPNDVRARNEASKGDEPKESALAKLQREDREVNADLVDRRDVIPAETKDEDRRVYRSVAEHDAHVTGTIPNDRADNPLGARHITRADWDAYQEGQAAWTVQRAGTEDDVPFVDPSTIPSQDYVNDPPPPASL